MAHLLGKGQHLVWEMYLAAVELWREIESGKPVRIKTRKGIHTGRDREHPPQPKWEPREH